MKQVKKKVKKAESDAVVKLTQDDIKELKGMIRERKALRQKWEDYMNTY